MSRHSAALLDSADTTLSVELPLAAPPKLHALRRLVARTHEACQVAFLLVYLAAAMTPAVRRALIGLDKV